MPQRTKRAKGPYSREQAEEHLFEELKEWRVSLGRYLDDEGGHPYAPSRTWNGLKAAHDKGRLLAHMTDWLADYKNVAEGDSTRSMVEIIKAGQRTWEHMLLEPNKPWSQYVTTAHRAKLLQCLADCYAMAMRETKGLVDAEALLKNRANSQKGH